MTTPPEEEVTTIILGYFMSSDVHDLLFMIIAIASLSMIITWTINFIPSLMKSILRKVKNKSIIYDSEFLDNAKLDDSKIGSDPKGFLEKWYIKFKG